MFRLIDKHQVTWPVTVPMPIDGGKVQKHKLDVVFEILPRDQVDGIPNTDELLDRVVIQVKTPIGAETGDEPIAIEGEIRKRFLAIPYVRAALLEAYAQAAAGREAQQKN